MEKSIVKKTLDDKADKGAGGMLHTVILSMIYIIDIIDRSGVLIANGPNFWLGASVGW